MTKTRNPRYSLMGFLGETEGIVREMLFARPTAWWQQARAKLQDLPKTNNDLGRYFADQGQWRDAILRFRITLYFRQDYPLAWFHLGQCYFRIGNRAKAAEALRMAVAQEPANRAALYLLCALEPNAVPAHLRPTRMPKGMVVDFFTLAAPEYDAIEQSSRYQGGQQVADAVKPMLRSANLMLVDFGCGTGIAARPWRTQSKEIIGVELVPAMVAVADGLAFDKVKLFDRVITADLAEATALDIPQGAADIVLCVNVASYVGELVKLIPTAANLLKAGGLLVITTEPLAAGHTHFGLSPDTTRFTHAPAYVRQLAQQAGLTVAREQRIELYPQVTSQLQVFSKP